MNSAREDDSKLLNEIFSHSIANEIVMNSINITSLDKEYLLRFGVFLDCPVTMPTCHELSLELCSLIAGLRGMEV